LSQAEASGNKRFFFEKKNQKTSIRLGSLYPDRPQPKQTKVFCFFFSKKKSFLILTAARVRPLAM
jgi:hypothetical protein